MITGSCSMQAMCGGHQEIFSYASTAGTLQEGSLVGQDGFMSISLQEGYSVSLCDWRAFGKEGSIFSSMGQGADLQSLRLRTSMFCAQLQIAAELVREAY